jgi:protein TonB
MDRRPATTPRTEQAAISDLTLTAGAPLAPPPQPRRWRPWYGAAAALLHVLVIAALLYSYRRQPPQQEALNNTGVSVVFQPGASTPETPRQAQIPTPAASPPPPPPTPAPNQPQPEVNLNLPEMALAPLPQPAPQPRPQTEARRAPTRAAPARHYMVMNNMSFGAPAPPTQEPSKNLDLSLPESDAQAVNTPELQIQGQVGADWEAGFNKWVYAHLYYPDAAAEQGQQGTVTVEFTAHRDGSVTGLHMTDSSGSPFLDQAWEGIFGQNQLPPFPPGGSDTLHITATVHYYIDH